MAIYGYYRHHLLDLRWNSNLISPNDKYAMEELLWYEGQLQKHIAKCTITNCPCHDIDTVTRHVHNKSKSDNAGEEIETASDELFLDAVECGAGG